MDHPSELPACTKTEAKRRRRLGLLATVAKLLVVALLCALLFPSCAPSYTPTCPGPTETNVQDGFILERPRFTVAFPSLNAAPIPSGVFWFSADDVAADRTVTYGWDRAFMLLRDPGTTECNLGAASPGCDECDLCAGNLATCRSGIRYLMVGETPVTVNRTNSAGSQQIATVTQPFQACLNRPLPFTAPSFEVDSDAEYTLSKAVTTCSGRSTAASLQTRLLRTPEAVVETGALPYRDKVDPTPRRFRFSYKPLSPNAQPPEQPTEVPAATWIRENFSPKIIVTRVRVLPGTDDGNGVLSYHSDPDPAMLRRMRPSRIMFLQRFKDGDVNGSFDEGDHRCYVDPNADDGGFDLTNCRLIPDGSSIGNFRITPAYMETEPARAFDWILEYKLEVGGLTELPNFGLNEVPVLEFTICNGEQVNGRWRCRS